MTTGRIIQEACQRYEVSREDFFESQRPKACRARFMAAHRMKTEMNLSLNEIGRRLNRHHTAVYYMLERYRLISRETPLDISQPDYSGEWAI